MIDFAALLASLIEAELESRLAIPEPANDGDDA